MWIKNSFFKYTVGIILVLLIIFLFGKVQFVLEPIKTFLAIIFTPALISGLLYYLFRPLVRVGVRIKIPKTLSILLVFLLFVVVFSAIGLYSGAIIADEFGKLNEDLPGILETIKDKGETLIQNENVAGLFTGKVQEQITTYAQKLVPAISNGLVGAVSSIAGIASVLIVIPFFLFYLLKDDHVFYKKIVDRFPGKYKNEMTDIMKETDKTLSTYIIGQGIIAVILCVLTYIGYLIIGLNYSFILAFFVLITSFIPLFGTIIGVFPAVLVGLAANPFMALKVLIVMIIVQQIEGNLISPFVIGKRLDIHPLTVIVIFLGAAALYGFVGMLIVVPFYAVLKVLFSGGLKLYRVWKGERVAEE